MASPYTGEVRLCEERSSSFGNGRQGHLQGRRMIVHAIQRFFERYIKVEAESPDRHEHALQLATAALLVEMTRADSDVGRAEVETVLRELATVFTLTPEETRELADLAQREVDHSTSLYQFTSLINRHFSPESKSEVIEMMWRVALADGKLDKYEEYLVRKVADLLYVPHRDFIKAKHRVQAGSGI
jgi:uncharacterized tellurite resistance protein B-like protein